MGRGLIFFLNLVPVVPITAVCYGAGLSRVSLRDYTLGVIAGLTPRAFAYSFFGDSLLDIGSTQIRRCPGSVGSAGDRARPPALALARPLEKDVGA